MHLALGLLGEHGPSVGMFAQTVNFISLLNPQNNSPATDGNTEVYQNVPETLEYDGTSTINFDVSLWLAKMSRANSVCSTCQFSNSSTVKAISSETIR